MRRADRRRPARERRQGRKIRLDERLEGSLNDGKLADEARSRAASPPELATLSAPVIHLERRMTRGPQTIQDVYHTQELSSSSGFQGKLRLVSQPMRDRYKPVSSLHVLLLTNLGTADKGLGRASENGKRNLRAEEPLAMELEELKDLVDQLLALPTDLAPGWHDFLVWHAPSHAAPWSRL